jgi:3-oxoacyl-[acyl-carrier protein] reductase
MAKEWGRYKVNVNAVGFGLIVTRLIQPLSPESKIDVKGHQIRVGVQQELLEKVTSASPLRRAGTVDEAAGAVLFFCSPLSDFVTGEVLMCAGGMHF